MQYAARFIRLVLALPLSLMLGPQCQAQMWTSIGPAPLVGAGTNPGPFAGRIAAIAVDPSDQSHWLAGAGNGGVWETHDAGAFWLPISDGWPTLAIGAVIFAASDPKTIYVGTGEATGPGVTKAGLGLMKSSDGGKTWSLIAGSTFARAAFNRLRVHPTNPSIVLAATSRGGYGRDAHEGVPGSPAFGVLKSSDGGLTWARVLAGQATALETDPTNFNNQYAAIGEQRGPSGIDSDSTGSVVNGIYRSTDGGETWALVSGPWGPSNALNTSVGRIELAIAPSNSNTIYASIQVSPNGGGNNTGLLGLYRTDNAWAPAPKWIQAPTGATGDSGYCGPGKCGYSNVISVDPSDPDTLFAGGGDAPGASYRCSNCSLSPAWKNLGVWHADHHAMTWAGNRLINGNDGGVESTVDHGDSWQNHSATISTVMFYGADLHPTNPNFALAGLRDNGTAALQGNSRWVSLIGNGAQTGPAGLTELGEAETAISASHSDTHWMSAWIWGVIGRTMDGGKTPWSRADGGIDTTGVAFVAPVRKCPSNDDVFLTGTNRMWRTNNFFGSAAPTWAANSPPSPFPYPFSIGYPGTILEIEYVASDTTCNTYVYGTRGGQIELTRDGGKTWTDLDPAKTLPPRPVNGLAFDPTNPNNLYAALSSFDDATPGKPGHVFKTTNALAASPTWANVSPPLNQPFKVIRVDPTNPKLIYAGSDTGLWRSTDSAATWVHDGPQAGLPNASIYDIKINPATGVTAIFTYGRGAFGMGFPAPPPPPPQITSGPRSPANGATYIAGGLVPGSWAQVQGTNLTSVTRVWNDSDFVGLGSNLPTKLDGVEAKVNGVSAAVYYVSATQVTFQVPSGILPGPPGTVLVSGPVSVQLFRDGVGSNTVTTTATSSSPGIFALTLNGKNYPVGVFLDGRLAGDPMNGPVFRKAKPGDVIQLFATGLFRTQAGVVLQPQTYTDVTVTIGDITIAADSAALVAPGDFQINFTVPQQSANLPEDDYPLSIQYNGPIGTSSPVTINSDPPGPMILPIQP